MNSNEEQKDIPELTLQQEKFCRYYTQDSTLYGNGTLSYAIAYGYDLSSADKTKEIDEKGKEIIGTSEYDKMYHTCGANASRLLINDKIISRVNDLLNEQLNEKTIDARLSEIILHGDDGDSIRAIQEFNKLRQRIVDKKDITSGGKPITIVFDTAFNKQSEATPKTTTNSNESQTL